MRAINRGVDAVTEIPNELHLGHSIQFRRLGKGGKQFPIQAIIITQTDADVVGEKRGKEESLSLHQELPWGHAYREAPIPVPQVPDMVEVVADIGKIAQHPPERSNPVAGVIEDELIES